MIIAVSTPFPWLSLLEYLKARLTPGRERIDGGCFIRKEQNGSVTVRFDQATADLRVDTPQAADAAFVKARIRHLFQPAHQADTIDVLRRDALLRERVVRLPGLRPLGCWAPFELCVRTLVGQQVSVKAAGTLMQRLIDRCGCLHADRVVTADLAGIGMPARRVAAIQGFARAVEAGTVSFDSTWPELSTQLATMAGFGPWTLGYLAIRLGRDPDAFPASDKGLIRAAGVANAKELADMAEAWRPLRAYAAMYLWAG